VAAGALGLSAVLLLLPGWARGASGDGESPADLTFQGTAQGGGAISITTTANRAGIVRAEADEVEFRLVPPRIGPVVETTISRTLYFQTPVSITDGQFEFGLPGNLFGMARGALRIEGAFLSDTEAAGTATLVTWIMGATDDVGQVDWAAQGPVDTPPGADDIAHDPTLEGSEGSLVFTMDPSGESVTSLVVKGVSFEPCTLPDSLLNIRMFFQPPARLEAGAWGLIRLPNGLHPIGFEGSRLDGQTLAGTIEMRGLFIGACEATVRWTTGAFPTPTATASATTTAPPAPSFTQPPTPAASLLPAAGSGGAQTSPLAPLVVVGCLLSLAVVLGAGAAWRARRR
jgi:hypothetical protein